MKHKIKIDHDRREVFVAGREVEFSPMEYAILTTLISTNKAMTRHQIGAAVGYDSAHIDLGTRVIDQHICRIKRKLKSEKGAVATVQRHGYKFKAEK